MNAIKDVPSPSHEHVVSDASCMSSNPRKRKSCVAIVVFLSFLLAAFALAVSSRQSLADQEDKTSNNAFLATYQPLLLRVHRLVAARPVITRIVGEHLEAQGARVSYHSTKHLLDMMTFADPEAEDVDYAIHILDRVRNTPYDIEAWVNDTKLDYGPFAAGEIAYRPFLGRTASMDQEWVYLARYQQSYNPFVIGTDFSAHPVLRSKFMSLNSTNSPSNTGLLEHQPSNQLYFESVMAVGSETPPERIVMARCATPNAIKSLDPLEQYASLVITDPYGAVIRQTACSWSDRLHWTSLEIQLSAKTWTFTAYACDDYGVQFHSSTKDLVFGLTIILLIMSAASACLASSLMKREADTLVRLGEVTAARDAHVQIIGYLCHEIRNPLHVLRSWLTDIVSEAEAFSQKVDPPSPGSFSSATVRSKEFKAGSPIVPSRELNDTCSGPEYPASCLLDAGVRRDILDALKQMQLTVNDVLDFSKIEQGTFQWKNREVRLSEVFGPLTARCRAYVPGHIAYRVRISEQLMFCRAMMDPLRLEQVVVNGISNAGKFARQGAVTVSVRIIQQQEVVDGISTSTSIIGSSSMLKSYLVVNISNMGEGLKTSSEDLFIPFSGQRVSKASGARSTAWKPVVADASHVARMRSLWVGAQRQWTLSSTQGQHVPASINTHAASASTGLGLALSRAIIKSAGGWLGLEDDSLGQTHFWFVVPMRLAKPFLHDFSAVPRSSHAPARPSPSRSDSGISAVQPVSDRSSDASGPSSTSSAAAGAGAGGLAAMEAGVASNMESGVPIQAMDGAPGARFAARSAQSTVPPTAGKYKPTPSVRAFNLRAGAKLVGSPAAKTEVDFSSLRVVYVDDESANRRVCQRILTHLGVLPSNITMLSDGQELIALAGTLHGRQDSSGHPCCVEDSDTSLPAKGPHIVLCDILMKAVSGIEAMTAIRSTIRCPVIAVTGSIDDGALTEYRGAGFCGTLGKPFSATTVQEAISVSLLSRGQQWFTIRDTELA